MTTAPLIATKMHLPRTSSDWIRRTALLKTLNKSLDQKVVLVSAPAGFGKTSFTASWASTTERKVAWISLGPGENDVSRFMRYLIKAVSAQLPAGLETKSTGKHFLGWESIEYGLTVLVNRIQARDAKITLVLDDLHILDNPSIQKALDFLINHLPDNFILVLVTRQDPPLPLAVLRGKGKLIEIRSKDLAFSRQETEEFFRQVTAEPLSDTLIKEIHNKTEGWITGIRLIAAAINQSPERADIAHALSGNIEQISDYLTSEVIENLPAEVEGFLTKTSILEKLSADLCNQVLDTSNSKEMLSYLARQNLFLEHLDHSGAWYRYHGLFQETLQSRLRQMNPGTIPKLHQRASSWFSAAGEFDLAIYHAHQASDDAGAAALLERHIGDLWEKGEFTTIVKWAQSITPAVITKRTQLSVYLSLALIFTGDMQKGIQRLNLLDDQISSKNLESARGWLAAGKTYAAYFQRNIPEILHAGKQALKYLPKDNHTWRGGIAIILSNAYIHLGDFPQAASFLEEAYAAALITENSFQMLTTRLHQAILNVHQGKLHRATSIIETALEDEEVRTIPTAGVLYAVWADILREKNLLVEAEQKLEIGLKLSSMGGGAAARAWTTLISIKLSHSKQDLEAMLKATTELDLLSTKQRVPEWVPVLEHSWKIRYHLLQENLSTAEHQLSVWSRRPQITSPFLQLEFKIAQARVEIYRQQENLQPDAAEELIETMSELSRITSTNGWREKRLVVLLLKAKTLFVMHEIEKALNVLQTALSLAEAKNYVRLFLEEGSQVIELIRIAAARRDVSRYAEVLYQSANQEQPTDLVSPLSDREMEVIALVSEGLSNSEIGKRLYITTGTVKVHINHIFQKLGVSNRTQAVTWAREIGLLP